MTREYRHPFPIPVTDLLTIHMPAAERLLGTKDLVVMPSQTHLIVRVSPAPTTDPAARQSASPAAQTAPRIARDPA
jgi:hypothetical protein